jgi:hypothetical protein
MGGGVAQRGGREALLQAAGKMFDRYGFVLLLCSNASVFAGIIRSCLGRKTRLCGYKRVNGCGCIAFEVLSLILRQKIHFGCDWHKGE